MKRLLCLLLAMAISILCCSCDNVQEQFDEYVSPADTAVIIDGTFSQEFRTIDAAYFAQSALNTNYLYTYQKAESGKQQYALAQEALADAHTAVLVVCLMDTSFAGSIVEAAKAAQVPVIFGGVAPSQAVLNSYTSCWYVGFDASLASETQAELVIDAYKADLILDTNHDYKFNYVVTSTNEARLLFPKFSSLVVNDIKLAGANVVMASSNIVGADYDALYSSLDALLLPQTVTYEFDTEEDDSVIVKNYSETIPSDTHSELFLCSDLTSSQAVLDILAKMEQQNREALAAENDSATNDASSQPADTDSDSNSADEAALADDMADNPYPYLVVCFGSNDAVLEAIHNQKAYGTVVRDIDTANVAIFTLCENLLRRESIVKDTDYRFENGKFLMLDYITITQSTGD